MGCPPIKLTREGKTSRAVSTIVCLVLPTSVTTVFGPTDPAISVRTLGMTFSGVATKMKSASAQLSLGLSAARSTAPAATAAARVSSSMSYPTISTGGSSCFNANPSEPPIRPSPIIVTRNAEPSLEFALENGGDRLDLGHQVGKGL